MEPELLDHKLCGFVCTVLTVNSPNPDICETLDFNTVFYHFDDGSDVGFQSENGVVLLPIDSEQCEAGRSDNTMNITASGSRKKRKMNIGQVHGSISVVHQLHALVKHKCLRTNVRLIRVEVGVNGEARAVLLVDVYLPVAALCSRWQFPKSGSVASALFKHLSCDWTKRSLLCDGKYDKEDVYGGSNGIWSISQCHVLGCKLHGNVPGTSKKRLFELHEIFKSLPSVAMVNKEMHDGSRVKPVDDACGSGIWEVTDDILMNILTVLDPKELLSVAATCRHFRSLAASIMPCLKLELFPHQQTAVKWMLQRERNAGIMPHPLYTNFATEDGFPFHMNNVSGEIITGVAPTIKDFHGGMFCDEPGLGKTITALSLILKTQGTLPDPPDEADMVWCNHNGSQKCGYYEHSVEKISSGSIISGVRAVGQPARRTQLGADKLTREEDLRCSAPKRARLLAPDEKVSYANTNNSPVTAVSEPGYAEFRSARRLSRVKRNITFSFEEETGLSVERKVQKKSNKKKFASYGSVDVHQEKKFGEVSYDCKSVVKEAESFEYSGWVQCDACQKWRMVEESSVVDVTAAWFCSMNANPLYQSCSAPEESFDRCQKITDFPGFFTKGTSGGKEQNVSFFTSVLKEHYASINSVAKKMLSWLAELSYQRLIQMETIGLSSPFVSTCLLSEGQADGFYKIFNSFGLRREVAKGTDRWYYPQALENLSFDVDALRTALHEPLNLVRLYLSKATLIVVPSNLVDHWKTQIQKHVRPGQLRVYVWTDHKKPSAHNLAWDYDVVITTFNRLSAEWGPRKKSVMMQVHWRRVMLDEGHTLGSSINLTNKLQMAISLVASNRWILTGTPTPNTPNSSLSHLQPLLKFLHDEAYGQNKKLWEAGIIRPFEAEMEEGRLGLLDLLHRCMISARKSDLLTIPPCIKKVTFLNFTEGHARSYNELVVTVRRNILMADWNDPSHVESLLNPKQWKFRSSTIKNVRLSCCVAGHIKVTDAGQDIQETMDILIDNGLDPLSEEYASIKSNLLYGGDCCRCKEWCRLPAITPCRHLLCVNCVALDSERCTFPGCGNLYEMETPETLARPENPNPKWPVPKDLIELQPSYKQDNWDPDWQSTSSSKVAYLINSLKVLQEANRESRYYMDEGNSCKPIQELLRPDQMNNSSTLLSHDSSRCKKSDKLHLEKVLIFSQFLEHIHVIEQQLSIAGIRFAGMYSPMHSSNKMKSLAMFQHDASCMALLMDGSAALGLDLSFVTRVFLMEPIWDRSMEEQVISRAHRMGATRPIHVETLAMHGTIEEQMLEFLQDADECKRILKEDSEKTDSQGVRSHRTLHDFAESNYLARLSFAHTNS